MSTKVLSTANTRISNRYHKAYDGWFNYYVNVDTGEKKFKLDEGDICVDIALDDFSREENKN